MIADEVRWVWQHVTSLLPASTMTQACTRLFFCGPESAGPLEAASAAAVGAASAAAAAAAASLACCCFCMCRQDVSLADQHSLNVLSSTQPVRRSMSRHIGTAATTVMTATTSLFIDHAQPVYAQSAMTSCKTCDWHRLPFNQHQGISKLLARSRCLTQARQWEYSCLHLYVLIKQRIFHLSCVKIQELKL